MTAETLSGKAIRDLGLTIEGTRLAPILARFHAELDRTPLRRLRPRCYLSTEWGVPFETISIAIPFYLARPDLVDMHRERVGHVEGTSDDDILRYLRHEMGHVVNYAYKLYDDPDWVRLFGAITQPYLDEYSPRPFSRRYVHHLPGWYAQKHPDEDWAETFAVWMTGGWRAEYEGWPEALAKLEYCDRAIRRVGETDPPVIDDELDEDVSELGHTLAEHYDDLEDEDDDEYPPGLEGALRAIVADLGPGPGEPAGEVAALLRAHEIDLTANVYRWTGHFPERTRALVRHLQALAAARELRFAVRNENSLLVALTTFVTALAMSHVTNGSYLPA